MQALCDLLSLFRQIPFLKAHTAAVNPRGQSLRHAAAPQAHQEIPGFEFAQALFKPAFGQHQMDHDLKHHYLRRLMQ